MMSGEHRAAPARPRAGLSRRRFLGLAGIGAGLSFVPVRRGAAQRGAAPVKGGTLVVGAETMGDNFVPIVTFQGFGKTWASNNIFETLYTYRSFKSLTPALATGHTVSPDGLVYTFPLRKGVKFHDGTPFNAEAVEFNYMRYLDKSHPYHEPNAVFRSSILPAVKAVRAKEEYVVEVVRERPSAAFVANLSSWQAGIMSPAAIKKHGVQDAGRFPVGTGPFVFEKAEKGSQAVLRAFDDYWGGRPPLDRVVIRAIPDDQAMTAALLAGEVDLTPFVDFKNLESFRRNPKLAVQVVPAPSAAYTVLNAGQKPFQDIRVRRAAAHAMNNKRTIEVVYYGEGDPAGGLTSLPLWAYAPHLRDYYKYDPARAKSLLAEAGGPADIVIHCQSSGSWPRWAELMQADLAAVGFKATIEKIDSSKFYGQMTEAKHQLFIAEAEYNNPDPEDIYNVLHGCDNPRTKRYGWCDPKFDELRATQSAERDLEKRKQILWEMQKVILDAAVQLPNFYLRFATVSSKRVQGFVPTGSKLNMPFDGTWLAKA
jgi:peptide/nickel transport system substrate-binding protein